MSCSDCGLPATGRHEHSCKVVYCFDCLFIQIEEAVRNGEEAQCVACHSVLHEPREYVGEGVGVYDGQGSDILVEDVDAKVCLSLQKPSIG